MTRDDLGAAMERARRDPATVTAFEVACQELLANPDVGQRYARHVLSLDTLRVDVAAGRVPDCPACRDSCCHGPHLVSLRLADCARLVDAGLDSAIQRPFGREAVYREHPELRQIETRPAFQLFPVLEQITGSCVFLGEDARCNIYTIRPAACRAFPYRIDDALDRVRLNSGCRSLRDDGSDETTAGLARAAVDLFNEKARDLLMIEYGRARLAALGLDKWLPDFARVLRDVADHSR